MIVLDTCALIWWSLDPEKLSTKASSFCSRIPEDGAVISSISLWEIGIKCRDKKLALPLAFNEYVDRLRSMEYLEIVPVDDAQWVENVALVWDHRDPVDRAVIALARLRNLQLVTKDQAIRDFYRKCIW